MKNRLTSLQMSQLSMPLLYSMFGEPLIVMLIFFRSGNMYFSESLAPALYGSANSKSMPFMDLQFERWLWCLFSCLFLCWSVPLFHVSHGRRETHCRWCKCFLQSQRVRHEDFVLAQLGYVSIQSLAWVCFRRLESDALDSAKCLHGFQCLFTVSWEEVIWHRHCI